MRTFALAAFAALALFLTACADEKDEREQGVPSSRSIDNFSYEECMNDMRSDGSGSVPSWAHKACSQYLAAYEARDRPKKDYRNPDGTKMTATEILAAERAKK